MTSVSIAARRDITRICCALVFGAALLGTMTSPRAEGTIRLTGAGASFPAPLYLRWFRDYYRAHPKVRADYQAIGSGAGVASFIDGRLDFAGSDIRLTPQQIAQADSGVVQIPMTAGAVVLIYNLPGIEGIRLSRAALAGIFSGRIARWDDPLVAANNPVIELPDEPVTVVVRSDASGTTYVMTRYLSAIEPTFAESVGSTMTPVWPKAIQERGDLIRGRGNDGVATHVKAIPGSIGYVQYAYAVLPGQQVATLENRAGAYIGPNPESIRATLEGIVLAAEDKRPGELTDPSDAAGYPVIGLSWLLLRKDYQEAGKRAALRDLIRYCLTEGQAQSESLGYIPAGEAAQAMLLKRLDEEFAPAGN